MKSCFLLRAGVSPTQNQGSHDFVRLRLGNLQEWRLTTMLVQDDHIEILYALAAIQVPQYQEWL